VREQPRNARQRIRTPSVIGAVIDLRHCLNLLDAQHIALVRQAHTNLVRLSQESGNALPSNSHGPDLLLRKLDYAVIRLLHRTREEQGELSFDTVRAAFFEGERLYDNAGFAAKNHIQVCVRNPACIKGYFRPIDEHGKPLAFT
jgi:hypothetical protein